MAWNESMWRGQGWDEVSVRTIQLDSPDLVLTGEEKHAAVALAGDFVISKAHHMRTAAGAGVVVTQKAEVRASPITSAARVRHACQRLDGRMNNPQAERLAYRPLNNFDI